MFYQRRKAFNKMALKYIHHEIWWETMNTQQDTLNLNGAKMTYLYMPCIPSV